MARRPVMATAGHTGSSEALHVIVTCTNRKPRVVPERLHLGSVPGSDTGERAREWVCRISADRSPLTAARDLYAGAFGFRPPRVPRRHCPGEQTGTQPGPFHGRVRGRPESGATGQSHGAG